MSKNNYAPRAGDKISVIVRVKTGNMHDNGFFVRSLSNHYSEMLVQPEDVDEVLHIAYEAGDKVEHPDELPGVKLIVLAIDGDEAWLRDPKNTRWTFATRELVPHDPEVTAQAAIDKANEKAEEDYPLLPGGPDAPAPEDPVDDTVL